MRGGGSKGTLEPLSVHWSPGWTKIQEMACCLSLQWYEYPAKPGAPCHRAKHTHLAQESEQLKEDPEDSGAVAGTDPAPNKHSEAPNHSECELHSVAASLPPCKSPKIISLLVFPKQKHLEKKALGNIIQPNQVNTYKVTKFVKVGIF